MNIEGTSGKRPYIARSLGRLVVGLLSKTAIGLLVLIAVIPLGLVLLVANTVPLILDWADRHD